MHYLDSAATAPLQPAARNAMLKVLAGAPANASSVHTPGQLAKDVLRQARQQVATGLGARDAEVIFTSGGTEANNLLIKGVALAAPRGKHLVTSAIEHSSVRQTCAFLAKFADFEVTEIPVDVYGRVHEAATLAAIRDDTTLVSIGLSNGEIGTVQSLERIGQAAQASGAVMHTDAVQAAAALPVYFAAGGWPGTFVDAMSVASHKFGGPQGAGALLLRSGIPLEPLLHGGGQESGQRSGTENLAALAGFGAAVATLMPRAGTRAQSLMVQRDTLVSRVLQEVAGAQLTGHPAERAPNHASFVVTGVSGESLLVDLDVAGIAASSGSACAAGKKDPSDVLLAMGYPPELAVTALRFTLPDPLEESAFRQLVDHIVQVLTSHTALAR